MRTNRNTFLTGCKQDRIGFDIYQLQGRGIIVEHTLNDCPRIITKAAIFFGQNLYVNSHRVFFGSLPGHIE
jgi:hypothetical protein